MTWAKRAMPLLRAHSRHHGKATVACPRPPLKVYEEEGTYFASMFRIILSSSAPGEGNPASLEDGRAGAEGTPGAGMFEPTMGAGVSSSSTSKEALGYIICLAQSVGDPHVSSRRSPFTKAPSRAGGYCLLCGDAGAVA